MVTCSCQGRYRAVWWQRPALWSARRARTSGTLENVDEPLVFRHARLEATAMPNADLSKLTESAPRPCEDRSLCDSGTGKYWRIRQELPAS
jgi:hypothetical protein